jgi:hypothetical protein
VLAAPKLNELVFREALAVKSVSAEIERLAIIGDRHLPGGACIRSGITILT